MTQVTIVAIPEEGSWVWDVSSEKVPHMTLLCLYDVEDVETVNDYVEHAIRDQAPVYAWDFYRGELGDQNADVLFFRPSEVEFFSDLRQQLRANSVIDKGYLAGEQYPKWIPHVTLGYPETPAKKETDQHPQMVRFDRIAVWTDDYAGKEFDMVARREDLGTPDVAMMETLVDEIVHAGVLGMKWGVRKDRTGRKAGTPAAGTPRAAHKKNRVDTAKPAAKKEASDSKPSKKPNTKPGKKPKLDVSKLSNEELKAVVDRTRLESEYKKLTATGENYRGEKKVQRVIKIAKSAEEVYRIANSPAGKAVTEMLFGAVANKAMNAPANLGKPTAVPDYGKVKTPSSMSSNGFVKPMSGNSVSKPMSVKINSGNNSANLAAGFNDKRVKELMEIAKR